MTPLIVSLDGATPQVAGVPGKVRRPLGDAEVEGIRGNAATYLELMEAHRAAVSSTWG
jgi:carbonic anhydrase/acetyltransferase-like protein (isoleucine patch superfamily)